MLTANPTGRNTSSAGFAKKVVNLISFVRVKTFELALDKVLGYWKRKDVPHTIPHLSRALCFFCLFWGSRAFRF